MLFLTAAGRAAGAEKPCKRCCGGVSGAGEFLLAPVREMVQPRVFCSRLGTPRIEKALLGNDAGIIGAAMLHPGA